MNEILITLTGKPEKVTRQTLLEQKISRQTSRRFQDVSFLVLFKLSLRRVTEIFPTELAFLNLMAARKVSRELMLLARSCCGKIVEEP